MCILVSSTNLYVNLPMNKYLPLTLSLIATSLTSGLANASSVNVAYEDHSLSNISLSGLSVSGSMEITDSLSIEVSTTSVDTTVSSGKTDIKYNGIGVGYNTELTDTIDLKVIVEHVSADFTTIHTTSNISGMVYEVSFTTAIADGIDGMIGLSESNASGATTNTIFGISVRVTDNMDLTFSSSNSQVKIKSLGLRYNF